jgi:hypothetical protein
MVKESDLEKEEHLFGGELFQYKFQRAIKEASDVELIRNTQIRTVSRNLDFIILCLAKNNQ